MPTFMKSHKNYGATAFVFVFLLGCLMACLITTQTDAKVIELSAQNFDQLTQNGSWMIKYFAPWCGHCKTLAPIFEQTSDLSDIDYKFAKMDCTQNKEFCAKQGITGYPTLKFGRDGKFRNYSGRRSMEGFKQFNTQMKQNPIQSITSESQLDEIIDDNQSTTSGAGGTIFVLFDNSNGKSKEYKLFKQEAYRMQGVLRFAHVDNRDTKFDDTLIAKYHVKQELGPAVVPVYKHSQHYMSPFVFSQNDPDTLDTFLDVHKMPLIVNLDGSNFDDFTKKDSSSSFNSDHFIVFVCIDYDSPDQNTVLLSKEFYDLVHSYSSLAKFAFVDAKKYNKYLAQFGLSESRKLPQIIVTHFPDYYYNDMNIEVTLNGHQDITHVRHFLDRVIVQKSESPVALYPWYSPVRYLRKLEAATNGMTEMQLVTITFAVLIPFIIVMFFVCWKCGLMSEPEDMQSYQKRLGMRPLKKED